CPNGDASTDPDYCSECGVSIGASPIALATPAGPVPSGDTEVCPRCPTPRTPGGRYCEGCRYDFETGSSSGLVSASRVEPAATSVAPNETTADQSNAAAVIPGGAPSAVGATPDVAAGGMPLSTSAPRLNVVVVTDPSLVEDEEMRKKCPPNAPELV